MEQIVETEQRSLKTDVDVKPDFTDLSVHQENVIVESSNKKKKRQYSNWFITVNTNKKIKADPRAIYDLNGDELTFNELRDRLKKSIMEILYEKLPDLVLFKQGDVSDIVDVNLDVGIEIGPKEKRLHAHASVQIIHTAKLHLDYAKLKTRFENALHSGISIDRKFYQTREYSIADYIHKYGLPTRKELQ